ncbi:MAG TPA: hypothetical protein VGX78_09550 [Pirellulales bacterium]|nr:hypothetical protein [Pirellulales bacterium]
MDGPGDNSKGVDPAMQSSGMVAFRATIMIACMVVLPLVAVLGTALPKVVQTAIHSSDRPTPLAGDGSSTSSPQSPRKTAATDATPAEMQDVLPRGRITSVRSVGSEFSGVVADHPPGATADRKPQATASLWSRDVPKAPKPSPRGAERKLPRQQQSTPPNGPPPQRRGDSALRATAYSEPVESEADPSSENSPCDDALSHGERRLRELGMASYRLETWGVTGELYRFSCQVALSNRGQAMKHFEATETSPAKVIESVLQQVEAWQATRR